MFDRMTDQARKVLALARKESQRFNHDFIDTEHILLGLLQAGGSVSANVLENLGAKVAKLSGDVEEHMQSGMSKVNKRQLPYTPGAMTVIELTEEEANELGHEDIGTGHILLGLLREHDGLGAKVLLGSNLKLERVRAEVIECLRIGAASERRATPWGEEERGRQHWLLRIVTRWFGQW